MTGEYFILEEGQKTGPFTEDELFDKPLEPTDMVATHAQTEWKAAHSLPQFRDYFKSEGLYFPTKENTSFYLLRLPAYILDAFIVGIFFWIMVLIAFPGYVAQMEKLITPQSIANMDFEKKILDQMKGYMIYINLIMFGISFIYNSVCESSTLQGSLGKYICGLAVVDDAGYRISFGTAALRNTGKLLYQIPSLWFGILAYFGYITMIWTPVHQALHDQFAKCAVVSKKR